MSVSLKQASSSQPSTTSKISVVMPCLNEEKTVGECVTLALSSMEQHDLDGEVIVVDNGSEDDSVATSIAAGARVVHCPEKGYGNAIRFGVCQSDGDFIIMGDSDLSYDFTHVPDFVAKLADGYDLVMGNRFQGGIAPGAMPWKNRYIGNPALSSILNFLFRSGAGDAHCGLRAFTRDAFEKMNLQCSGMEFASEIVVKAAKLNMNISEIPTTLSPDGRGGRMPHLNPWRDGWRHLRFLLMASPLHLFILPALLFLLSGILMIVGGINSVPIGESYRVGPHWIILGTGLSLIGLQVAQFGILARHYSHQHWFSHNDKHLEAFNQFWTLERGILISLLFLLTGLIGDSLILYEWVSAGYGPLHRLSEALWLTLSIAVGIQIFFFTFLYEILSGGQAK